MRLKRQTMSSIILNSGVKLKAVIAKNISENQLNIFSNITTWSAFNAPRDVSWNQLELSAFYDLYNYCLLNGYVMFIAKEI
jgi:hypothetical protein